MELTTIMIPSVNGVHRLSACVASIRANTRERHEILVIDNGSVDATLEFCRKNKLSFLSFPLNVGFPEAFNSALKLAGGANVLLLSNDAVVAEGWLTHLLAGLHEEPNVGIAAPLTGQIVALEGSLASVREKTGETSGMGPFHPPTIRELQRPSARPAGYCLLFRKTLTDEIGGMDERFPLPTYALGDFCLRAQQAGYRLNVCRDAQVRSQNEAAASFGQPDRPQRTALRMRKRFIDKWGFDPDRSSAPEEA